MNHRKVDVEHANLRGSSHSVNTRARSERKGTDQFRIGKDGFGDTLARKRLLPKPLFDLIEHLGVTGVGLVQHILQCEIRRTKPVTEMLGENPTGI